MTTPSPRRDVLRMTSSTERDVFTVRQRGREIAEAVGLDRQDQLRLAAALSDVGRDRVRHGITAVVTFTLDDGRPTTLRAEFSWQGEPPERVLPAGRTTAIRLLDVVDLAHADGRSTVTLVKQRPPTLPALSPVDVARLRETLAARRAADPLDELRTQNQELLDTLENVERQRKELLRLNEELEETNQGVMALYKELSDELDETNRGVVALYGELNEKSTQLKAVNEAKTRFWSTISHELRSPINSVIGLARLLADPDGDPLTDEQRRQVRLTVRDTGIGIPENQVERVFEEFHQVRNPLQTRATGTGLGLSYARRLAEILGGHLTLSSVLGQGTTVTLELPVRDPDNRGLPDLGTVLVVDDDESFRDRMGTLLREFTDAVHYAEDGRAALDAVAGHKPGLVCLDLYMPGMNGREVLGVLREKPELRDIPVIVVTSTAPEGLDLSSAGLGAALLPKSHLSVETIRLAITEALMVLPRTVRE